MPISVGFSIVLFLIPAEPLLTLLGLNYQAKIPTIKYGPSKEGLSGISRNEDKSNLPNLAPAVSIEKVSGNSKVSLGAIPKKPVKNRQTSSTV